MRAILIKIVIIIVSAACLNGCMNAAVTSAQAVYDRHNIQRSLNDHYATYQAYNTIHSHHKEDHYYDDSNISIATFNNVMLVTGQIPSPKKKAEIETLIKKEINPTELYNLAEVTTPTSNFIRFSDAWITTKIKSQLIAINEMDPSKIKVVTENGTVYLMGIIPPRQAEIAVQVARTTSGVQNVVKIFSYLRVSKT